MSENLSPRQSMGPLSVGNVVSAGLRLYRDRFKLYFRLAFTGYLWVLVPIYGWAKYSAISGLISRLAFRELIERPETVSEARSHVNPKMWSFFGAGLLVGLIVFGVVFGAVIVFSIVGGILVAILGQNSTTGIVVLVLLGIAAFVLFLFGYLWLLSRLFIVEVPLAIEDDVDAVSAISRSWKLTEGFVLRLVGVVSVAFLLTLPISIVVQIFSTIIQLVLAAFVPPDSPNFFFLLYLLILPISFASGSLLMPFWQAIKAVIYYDLRSRR
ncbi:MAG TPA: hypothetical protein V6C95_12325, partial [Coleofasciculaceae cyanobacterium]